MRRSMAVLLGMLAYLSLSGVSFGSPGLTTRSLQAALRTSLAMNAVPADLTPPLRETATPHLVWLTLGNSLVFDCNPTAHPVQLVHPVGCQLGDRHSQHVMVLFGDSNAGSWVPAVDAVASNLGYRLVAFVFPGCGSQLPVPGVSVTTTTLDANPAVTSACAAYHAHVAAAVRAVHPEVIVAARVGMDSGGTPASWPSFATGWQYTFNQLTLGNPHVKKFLLQTTPNVGKSHLVGGSNNIALCLSVHPSHMSSCSPSFLVGRDTPWSMQTYFDRDRYAAPRAGAILVPTAQWFCTIVNSGTSQCPAVIAHRLVYVDQDHVSIAYMRYIAPLLRSSLRSLGLPAYR
jgi:SGNH domain (fused to AT3 domains)